MNNESQKFPLHISIDIVIIYHIHHNYQITKFIIHHDYLAIDVTIFLVSQLR